MYKLFHINYTIKDVYGTIVANTSCETWQDYKQDSTPSSVASSDDYVYVYHQIVKIHEIADITSKSGSQRR